MKTVLKYIGIFLSITLLVILMGCSEKKGNSDVESIGDSTPYAERLHLSKHDDVTIAKIFSSSDTVNPIETYLLIPRDKDVPKNLPEGTVIRTPVQSLLVYSTVTAEALMELGSMDVIKGVVDAQYFTRPEIKEGIESGRIVDAGASSNPTAEKVIALHPDAIVLNIYDGMDVAAIDALNVPIIKMSDNYETTPLGRAEWIKFIGALTGKEAESEKMFTQVARDYNTILERNAGLEKRPKVLTETMYEGVWYVPGGNSFQSHLIYDSGGNYFRKDDQSTGSLSLNFEQVLASGRDADVWLIKVFGEDLTKEGLLKKDARYGNFNAVKSGGVYYTNTADGTLFYDMAYHPERILADYSNIFTAYSEGKEANALRYFRQMK
ncbi:MAG: ABC transporter substrate-binding protein [Prevotella sp.]|nr:ABC transporter substrate-binding protein [Bacteroides sp.]MCM1366097.1 ABC transporter substrate-binding protein [Prevotella sp.]MCM1436582.1 ABC transporter substrate-binding protein [Prevotella sp.]